MLLGCSSVNQVWPLHQYLWNLYVLKLKNKTILSGCEEHYICEVFEEGSSFLNFYLFSYYRAHKIIYFLFFHDIKG